MVLNHISTTQHKSVKKKKKKRNEPPLKEILNVKSRKSERAEQNEYRCQIRRQEIRMNMWPAVFFWQAATNKIRMTMELGYPYIKSRESASKLVYGVGGGGGVGGGIYTVLKIFFHKNLLGALELLK